MKLRLPSARSSLLAAALCATALSFAGTAFADDAQPPAPAEPALAAQPAATPPEAPPVAWVLGPNTGDMGGSDIKVPQGFRFAGAADTKKLMEFMGNPVSGGEVGFIAPDDDDWFVVFEFEDTGYVKDDDKNLDADALLADIKAGTEEANAMRRERGWGELHIQGWEIAPRYDPATHNLEWAVRGESEGARVINFNTKLLGRRGVTTVSLVLSGDQSVEKLLPRFRELMAGFAYKAGETYGEYKTGDKLATYGLAALVTGGAAAVAVKTGFFAFLAKGGAKLFAVIGVALAAVVGKLKSLFTKKR